MITIVLYRTRLLQFEAYAAPYGVLPPDSEDAKSVWWHRKVPEYFVPYAGTRWPVRSWPRSIFHKMHGHTVDLDCRTVRPCEIDPRIMDSYEGGYDRDAIYCSECGDRLDPEECNDWLPPCCRHGVIVDSDGDCV